MENKPKRSVYKGISLCIKLLIVAASCWYIYTKVFHRPDRDDLSLALVSSFTGNGVLLLLIVVALMPLNWGLEAKKWRILVLPLEQLTRTGALKAVLAGVAVSTVTPNRAGEFAGRIFFLRKADKLKAAWLTFVGSSMQLFVTLLMGAAAFFLYGFLHVSAGDLLAIRLVGLLSLSCLVAALLLFALFPLMTRNSGRSGNRLIAALEVVHSTPGKTLFTVFSLSLLRYLVFLAQFLVLLYFFDAGVEFTDALILIPLTFFAISVIPTVALSEVAVRGSTAVMLFLPVTTEADAVLAASITLWVINVALPALAGCIFVFRLKFFKTE